MNILAVGDLHGDMESALRLVEHHRPDILLSPGDWGDPGEVPPHSWEALLSRVPVYTVYGNHDDVVTLSGLRNADGSAVLLPTGRILTADGLRLAGLSGIWAKSHRMPYYITDEDVDAVTEALAAQGAVDILLTHGCPQGVVDLTPSGRQGGQPMFRRALKTLQPRLFICGHLHRRQSHRTRDGALLLNTGDGRRGDYWLVDSRSWETGFGT